MIDLVGVLLNLWKAFNRYGGGKLLLIKKIIKYCKEYSSWNEYDLEYPRGMDTVTNWSRQNDYLQAHTGVLLEFLKGDFKTQKYKLKFY